MNRRDFWVIMVYVFQLQHSTAEATRNIGNANALAFWTQVRYWSEMFFLKILTIEYDPIRGWRVSLGDQVSIAAIEAKPSTIIRKIAADIGVRPATVSKHWPGEEQAVMTPDSLQHSTTSNLFVRLKDNPPLDRLINVDEKWNGSCMITESEDILGG